MLVDRGTFLKRVDWSLILVIFIIQVLGLINLWSTIHNVDTPLFEFEQKFVAQIIWVSIGWVVFILATVINYNYFLKFSFLIYFINLLLLLLVFFVGESSYGAKRWIDLGFFKLQPSEPMKYALVLVLAKVLSKFSDEVQLKNLTKPLILTVLPFILTVRQPDLGTAMVFVGILAVMLLFIGISKKLLLSGLLLCMVIVPVAWKFGLKQYQKERVMTFVNPSKDPQGTGYNSNQSKIAVGSGGIYGKGFHKGTQSQLEFLPERHTDFVFSVLSEEHGFIGSMFVISLFVILIGMGIKIASLATDKSGAIMAVGCSMTIFIHMSINIAMVIGLLPIVGIPLPLLSYGGSNLVPTMLALGFISSISARKNLF